MIYEYTKDEKWSFLLQVWLSNMSINTLFDYYEIPKIIDITSKGIFDGISGIGWLYLYASDSIGNLLLLETK